MIQEAHKKADNNFNDFVAQLYEQEFKTQEKAKYEHIKQAKEKAIEEERISKEQAENRGRTELARISGQNRKRTEPDDLGREKTTARSDNTDISNKHDEIAQTEQNNTSSIIGTDWSTVSPKTAANYMASKTGVSASKWLDVIYKESSGNPYALNSLSCYGLLQIMQSVHGQVSNLSPQDYLDKAVSIYQSSGGTAWQTW